jgi:hypothetical protein
MNRVSGPIVPGSEHIPFRPINAHGKTPVVLRRDGTVIDWKNPLREVIAQVKVLDREKGEIAIGPKVAMAVADQLCATVKLAIKSGKISGWSHPHVVPCAAERAVARVF